MSFKKAFALAIASMAVAGAANAAVNDGSTGNSEIFLVANKVNAGSSYTYVFDTGLNYGDFLPGSAAAGTNQSFNVAATSAWTSFLSQAGGASGVVWAVYGYDGAGDPGTAGDLSILMTSNKTASGMVGTTTTNRLTNGRLGQGTNTMTTFLSNTNLLANHDTITNGASVNQGQGATDGADYTVMSLFRYGASSGTPAFSAANAIDTVARFAKATISAGTNADVTNFSTGGADIADIADAGVSKWSLTSNGLLTYTAAVAAPIPEPADWAFMVAGLGLVGMIARRRRTV